MGGMARPSEQHDRPLREEEVDPDPLGQLRAWQAEAEQAGVPLPHAMSLATATRDGRPSIRSVLLKEVEEDALVFFTNYRSRKGRELAENPRAAVAFRWVELERELRVEGVVERLAPEESDAYFAVRPRESQIAALVSPQSEPITREELEGRFAEAARDLEGGPVPRPPHWGGYRLRAESVELWQGRPGRLHDRLRYRRTDGGWTIERLAP